MEGQMAKLRVLLYSAAAIVLLITLTRAFAHGITDEVINLTIVFFLLLTLAQAVSWLISPYSRSKK